MVKFFQQLKPFFWPIILIILLIFGQAMTDLALPDYLSKIVNIGIQQNGIQNAVPEAIRASEMSRIKLFLNENDKAVIDQDFILLDKDQLSESEYAQYLREYPLLATEPVYKLNTANTEEISSLNTILGIPEMVVYTIETKGVSSFLADSQITIPEGTDPFALLASLPPSQQDSIREILNTKLGSISESTITQYTSSYLNAEYVTIGIDEGRIQRNYILNIGGLMLLLALLGTICSVAVGFLASWVAAAYARNTRDKIFRKVEGFSNIEFDKYSTASLITRTTNDVIQIQMMLTMGLRLIFLAPILGIGAIFKVIGEAASLTWIIAAAVVLLLIMISVIFSIAIPKFKMVQKLIDQLNRVSREILAGLMVIRAFNTQKREEKNFDKVNTDLTNTNLFINRVMVFMMPMMMLIMNGTMLLIIWFGAKQVDLGNLQVGSLMAFMQYAMLIIFSFMMVSMAFFMIPRAAVSVQRINEVLATEPVIVDPIKIQSFDDHVRGRIEFKNVSFKYPGAEDYVLHNISFTAHPLKTTAIIGSTGSGKSTLISLIPRFYDVAEGSITVDGVDIRNISQHDLRQKIGYVPQKAILFSGSIENNVKYGNENASLAELDKAVEIAQAKDIISENSQGYATDIAQAGTNLSGGQKQRLSIARALIKKPEILIFDDSFSALDFKTDSALRRALQKETGDATVLIVGQRISTIMNADQIIVLNNGKIAGIGTHKDLMQKCEVYQELALSQLSKEELI